MAGTPVHDWVKPRLDALVADAVAQGMEREVVVAVLTDIVEGPGYNTAAVTEADTPQPDGRTDPAQEPISDGSLPITRGNWYQMSIDMQPDPI